MVGCPAADGCPLLLYRHVCERVAELFQGKYVVLLIDDPELSEEDMVSETPKQRVSRMGLVWACAHTLHACAARWTYAWGICMGNRLWQ